MPAARARCRSSPRRGKGNIVTLTGGADTITDPGSDNTYVLPAADEGSDTFTGNVLTINDTLGSYLTVSDSANSAMLSIVNTAGGAGTVIATINGATTATLQTMQAPAIT
jgi:hypothetical protein